MIRLSSGLALLLLLLAGCGDEMAEQSKLESYESAPAFPNGMAAQLPPAGTVAREQPDRAPAAVDADLLERGRERFGIYCAPCHGPEGRGDGEIVQRGFPVPPSYHTTRLREASAAHYYRVITDGYGVMYGYGDRVAPRDRWAIIAYIRALQLALAPSTGEADEPGRSRAVPAGEAGQGAQ